MRTLVAKLVRSLVVALVVLGPLFAAGGRPVRAATLSVTKVDDTNDGACDADCSLREAIVAANEGPDVDTIMVPPGIYTLTRGPRGEDAADGGDLDITGELNVIGAGSRRTTIDASGIPSGERAIDIVGSGTSVFLTLLTVRGGVEAEVGGGIRSAGPVRLTDVTVRGNRASSGGGIDSSVRLILYRSEISGNQTSGNGSGVEARGTAKFTSSTISGNEMTDAGHGSAIHLGDSARLTAINTTIANNTGEAPDRGAIAGPPSAIVTLQNSVLGNAPMANCFSVTVQSTGHNVASDASCDLNLTSDQPETAPALGPLQNNGGPTATHALLAGSPAIDAVPEASCPTKAIPGPFLFDSMDQRLVMRPQDGDNDGAAACDAGAFEVDEHPTVTAVAPADGATGVRQGANVVATFAEAMSPATIDANTVKLFRAGTNTPIAAVVSYDAATKQAILNPDALLERGVRYRAIVTAATRDAGNNQLDQNPSLPGLQPKAWSFTVRS